MICLWDAETPHNLQKILTGHSEGVNILKYSPDGNTLVSGSSDGTIRLWKKRENSHDSVVLSLEEMEI